MKLPAIRAHFLQLILLQPGFPAALEHEHFHRKLRFFAKPFGNFAGEIATLRAAINNDLFSRATTPLKIAETIRSSDLRSTKSHQAHDRERTGHPAERRSRW